MIHWHHMAGVRIGCGGLMLVLLRQRWRGQEHPRQKKN